jgi:glycine hydroxymethyltransferase
MNFEEVLNLGREEFEKRDKELTFIASENYCSENVLKACGSIFMQKYSEGFPFKRYYEGCEVVDKMEQECIDTVLELFNAKEEYYAQVQANSGASANMIVYNAVLKPNDIILAPDVKDLGHISHSHPKSFLSKYHWVKTYGVDDNGFIDYREVENLAIEYQPKLIIAGASNYSREIDYKRFREIANECNAKLMADIAHTSIFHAHGLLQSPVGVADFITSTTHKCMGSARSAFILYKKEYHKDIRLSTIPSLFGGQLANMTYAKLIGFKDCLTEESREYSKQILKNMQALIEVLQSRNIPIVSGGSDNHLCTIDLKEFNISGKSLATILAECGFICNANTVPKDPRSFLETSGIRIGTPAVTKRGLKENEIVDIINKVSDIINLYSNGKTPDDITLAGYKNSLKNVIDSYTNKYPLKRVYPTLLD